MDIVKKDGDIIIGVYDLSLIELPGYVTFLPLDGEFRTFIKIEDINTIRDELTDYNGDGPKKTIVVKAEGYYSEDLYGDPNNDSNGD